MQERELRFVMISRGVSCAGRNITKIISGRKGICAGGRKYEQIIIRDQRIVGSYSARKLLMPIDDTIYECQRRRTYP